MQNISDVMTHHACVVDAGQTIGEAAALMRDKDIGSVAVRQDGALVGMLTDRDIATRAVAGGLAAGTPVRDVMTAGIKYCFEDEPVGKVATNMARLGIRRLPVLSRSDCLVGFVSLSNLALDERPHAAVMNVSLTEPRYSSAALMRSVCCPHRPSSSRASPDGGVVAENAPVKVSLPSGRAARVVQERRAGGAAPV